MSASPATQHKEKGNEAFKAGNYPEAIGHYTAAILADGTDPTFPLNRAAAYLKLNKNEDAERDCSTVLKLQPNNVKAMFRRAQARVGLGKLTEARADLVIAAKADPGNTAIRAEFAKVEELMAEAAKKAKTPKGTPISVPSHPPDQASRTPYRRRVPIAIKDDDEPQSDKQNEIKPIDTKKTPPKGILKGGPSTPAASTNSTSKSLESPPPVSAKSGDLLTPVSTRAISSTSLQGGSSVPAPAEVPAPVGKVPTPVLPASPRPGLAPAPTPVTDTAPTATTPAQSSPLPTEPISLPAQPDATPPTLITFLQKWTNANSDGERAKILFTIPPASIPTLFGPTLESPLLGTMLAALSWAAMSSASSEPIRGRAVEYMRALARVPRFTTLVMFLDGEEKKSAARVWDVVGGAGEERKRWGC
ncbi:hypothetical protein FS749_007849 [Ceratobasidium sp. UAMH 11750]|nr:hypothetical protein FS749_007849 [Ceratobasidium sp. UAMH 11750]